MPEPTPVPEPTPLRLPDFSVSCPPVLDGMAVPTTAITGQIVNEEGLPVKNMLIRVRTLDACADTVQAQITTQADGTYRLASMPAEVPLEIEVVQPGRPSGFYTTRLQSNAQQLPHINYYPFTTVALPITNCVAANSDLSIAGDVNLSQASLPADADGIVRARALGLCNPYADHEFLTQDQSFAFRISVNMTAPRLQGQLTLSLKGRPTEIKYVPFPIIPPAEESYNFELLPEAPALPELPSVWDKQTRYPLPEDIPPND